MSDSSIQSKLERAAAALVATPAAGVSCAVFTGLDSDAITLPCVICEAGDATPIPGLANTGIVRGELQISVRSNKSDDTPAQHEARAAAIFDAFATNTVAADMSSSLADFTAIGVEFGASTQTVVDDSHVSTMAFVVVCCPSDLT